MTQDHTRNEQERSEDGGYPSSHQLAEAAWGIIANAGQGNWDIQTPEWREAAARWRDRYHADLSAPRMWSLPPEPGPEVTHVNDRHDRRWRHERDHWCHVDEDDAHRHDDWAHVLVNYGPLSDATPVTTEGEA